MKVSRGILYQWRDKQEGTFRKKRPGPVVDTPAITALKKEVDQLKIALADKTLEAGFFKGVPMGRWPTNRHENTLDQHVALTLAWAARVV